MPELPEVEITMQSIKSYVLDKEIRHFAIHQPKLRWRVDTALALTLPSQTITKLQRRGKYIIAYLSSAGALIIHLGMSGKLQIVDKGQQLAKHQHWVMDFGDLELRYDDPRRFGSLHYSQQPLQHKLIAKLGVEPLSTDFADGYLYQLAQNKTKAVKGFIMDSHIVTGVGNIYANEALFMAGINPETAATKISEAKYNLLQNCIKKVLKQSIKQGGSTLKDFKDGAGNSGYFQLSTFVYGRQGEPCKNCSKPLQSIRQQQRITVYCDYCQKD